MAILPTNTADAMPTTVTTATVASNMTPIRIRGKKRGRLAGAVDAGPSKKRTIKDRHGDVSFERTRDRASGIKAFRLHPHHRLSRSVTPNSASIACPSSLLHEFQLRQQQHYHLRPHHHPILRRHSTSPLELLPPELLQQIFLQNCNPSLPLASPMLASKLSDPHIYTQFCVRVFCQLSCKRSKNVWTVAGGVDESDEELMRWRGQALRWRWMDWGIFEKAQSMLLEKEGKRLAEEVFSKGSTEDDRNYHTGGLRLWLGDKVRVPGKLLRWPCSGVQLEFLRALIRAGATVDVASLDYEVVRDTWLKAVKDRDYRLVHLLMAPGVFKTPGLDNLKLAVRKAKGDVAMGKLIVEMLNFGDGGYWGGTELEPRVVEEQLFSDPRDAWRKDRRASSVKVREESSGIGDEGGEDDDEWDLDYVATWTDRHHGDKTWVREALETEEMSIFW